MSLREANATSDHVRFYRGIVSTWFVFLCSIILSCSCTSLEDSAHSRKTCTIGTFIGLLCYGTTIDVQIPLYYISPSLNCPFFHCSMFTAFIFCLKLSIPIHSWHIVGFLALGVAILTRPCSLPITYPPVGCSLFLFCFSSCHHDVELCMLLVDLNHEHCTWQTNNN